MHIAIVIPAYKVKKHILSVIEKIDPEVETIIVVDDACPEKSSSIVENNCSDSRVIVIKHTSNQGVGAAMISGYNEALKRGADILVKVDGDGQMDPRRVSQLIAPIVEAKADYVKGNRFYRPEYIANMPFERIIGNAICSFFSKLTSGYWNIMDPANGFTAIHAMCFKHMNMEKLDKGYFFESDMLFRLYVIRAVVKDIPLEASYKDEASNMSLLNVSITFPFKYLNRFIKRIIYTYYIRDFNVCSVQLLVSMFLLSSGVFFGVYHWIKSSLSNVPATTGTVMIAALLVILGFQLFLAAVNYDVANIPREVIHKHLKQLGVK